MTDRPIGRRVFLAGLGGSVVAGCAPVPPDTSRRLVTGANDFSSFDVYASADRKTFAIVEILANRSVTGPVDPAPEPSAYLVAPPKGIRKMPNTWVPGPAYRRLVPDPLEANLSYLESTKKGPGPGEGVSRAAGKISYRGVTFDAGKRWTNAAYFSRRSNRIYLVTGENSVRGLFFGGLSGKSSFEVFDATSGHRIGDSVYLGWGDVGASPTIIQTFDDERILFVTGTPIPDVALYLPGDWPSLS